MRLIEAITAVSVCVGLGQLASAHADQLSAALGGPNDRPSQLAASKPVGLWSVELGAGVLVSNVRTSHEDGYTLAPIELTLSRSFDKVYMDNVLEGVLRGSPEVLLRGYHTVVVHGIESRLDGADFGVRYNFVKVRSRWVPFVESAVGFALADSRGNTIDGQDHGLGQDLNFNFSISAGLRYDIGGRWYIRPAAVYSHYSNAGLSEPERQNRQIDGAGPVLSVGSRF